MKRRTTHLFSYLNSFPLLHLSPFCHSMLDISILHHRWESLAFSVVLVFCSIWFVSDNRFCRNWRAAHSIIDSKVRNVLFLLSIFRSLLHSDDNNFVGISMITIVIKILLCWLLYAHTKDRWFNFMLFVCLNRIYCYWTYRTSTTNTWSDHIHWWAYFHIIFVVKWVHFDVCSLKCSKPFHFRWWY